MLYVSNLKDTISIILIIRLYFVLINNSNILLMRFVHFQENTNTY